MTFAQAITYILKNIQGLSINMIYRLLKDKTGGEEVVSRSNLNRIFKGELIPNVETAEAIFTQVVFYKCFEDVETLIYELLKFSCYAKKIKTTHDKESLKSFLKYEYSAYSYRYFLTIFSNTFGIDMKNMNKDEEYSFYYKYIKGSIYEKEIDFHYENQKINQYNEKLKRHYRDRQYFKPLDEEDKKVLLRYLRKKERLQQNS